MEDGRVRILLVEDDPDDVWVMRSLLGDRWAGPFELVDVGLLSAAFERYEQGGIDVLLLDLSLPDSQGLETFLQASNKIGDVPIVVLTGLDDETTAVKAVQAGAQDYLVKGQVDDNLLVRSIRYAIERSRRHKAERELQATSQEFRIAQQIQKRLFPTKPPQLRGFDIAGAVCPANETAGDYFDYIPIADEGIGVVVGDVSSHGMGPALVMAETRACLRAFAQSFDDVGEILTRTNRVLVRDADELHFVTLTLARLDPTERTMIYASAGQRGYLIEPSGQVLVLDSTSIPLGIDSSTIVPKAPPIRLRSNQLIVFCTDGVVETESPSEEHFGVERTLDLVRQHRDAPAVTIVETLYTRLDEFRNHRPQNDDITAVIIKVLPE